MEKQNLLMAALIHLIKFQSTHCATARERALMMFDALAQLNESNAEIDDLCLQANALLSN
jgi:predicted transcriptional regulator